MANIYISDKPYYIIFIYDDVMNNYNLKFWKKILKKNVYKNFFTKKNWFMQF